MAFNPLLTIPSPPSFFEARDHVSLPSGSLGKEGACVCVMRIPLLLMAPDTCLHTPGGDDALEPTRESKTPVQNGGPPAPFPCFPFFSPLPGVTQWDRTLG